jgi:drug/metabolite transporter (DMT)-like permease
MALNSLLASGLGDYLYFVAIDRLSAYRAVPISYTYIAFSYIWSSALQGRQPSRAVVLGAALSIMGVWVMLWRKGSIDKIGVLSAVISMFLFSFSPLVIQRALSISTVVEMLLLNSLIPMPFFLVASLLRRNMSREAASLSFFRRDDGGRPRGSPLLHLYRGDRNILPHSVHVHKSFSEPACLIFDGRET